MNTDAHRCWRVEGSMPLLLEFIAGDVSEQPIGVAQAQ
jgi:hypothetical protein